MTSINVKSGDIHCILDSVGNIVTSYLDKMSIKVKPGVMLRTHPLEYCIFRLCYGGYEVQTWLYTINFPPCHGEFEGRTWCFTIVFPHCYGEYEGRTWRYAQVTHSRITSPVLLWIKSHG